jgi:hypothetical protein
MQELSNRVKDLLQDVCRGFYRKLRVFYRMSLNCYRMSLNCYRMSLNCYRMVYRGGLRWGEGDGWVGRDVRGKGQASDGSGMGGWDGRQVEGACWSDGRERSRDEAKWGLGDA